MKEDRKHICKKCGEGAIGVIVYWGKNAWNTSPACDTCETSGYATGYYIPKPVITPLPEITEFRIMRPDITGRN